MLTPELIKANEALKGLSDEQVSAIATLSKNDEDAVIGNRFGEVYRQMDATIEKHLGIKRDGDEKTYLYLERASKAFADKYSDYDSLKGTIADLEAKVAKGGDEALKAKLESLNKELETTKNQFNTLKTSYDSEKANHEKALNDYKIDNEIARAKEGFKFKSGFSEAVMNTLIAQAINNIKSKNPTFEVRDGKERLIFHDANGSPLNNAENQLNPYTAKELLTKEFEAMDILEKAHAKGAGASGGNGKSNNLVGASTKVEATEAINKILSERGIAKTSLSYQSEFNKLWSENGIDKLPLN